MYENIGDKIKGLAVLVFLIGLICAIIYGFILMEEDKVLLGLLTMVLGGVGSWLGSLTLYGFGRLVECTEYIARGEKLPPDEYEDEDSSDLNTTYK
ncbi:MAG: hypothetical protein IKL79_00285 [Clostridia bacterium]|nr:hypothetical protein [Clostridia bacterium]